MKKFLASVALVAAVMMLVPAPSLAVGNRPVGMSATNLALTTAPSTLNPLVTVPATALRLSGFTGYRVTLCAATGQTLSGAGSLQVYYWSPSMPVSVLCAAGGACNWSRSLVLDETVSVTATSCNGAPCQCQTFGDHRTSGMGEGFIMVVPNGVTVSGGLVNEAIEGVSAT